MVTCTKEHGLIGGVISLWMFLNFALNFFNKWAFTKIEDGGAGFSFPIFYTMWNTLASFCGANLFSYFIEKKTYSYPILGAALVLTFGACMSIPYDSPKVTPIGSFLALWSTAMSGLRPVLTALLLKNSKESGLTPVPL